MCRIAAIGDLVTHTRPQLECSAVTKFGIEFSLDNVQYMSEIAPVIRRIASAIFDQAHPQIADGEGAPGGLSRLAEMDGRRKSDRSVTVNGSVGIFMRSLPAFLRGSSSGISANGSPTPPGESCRSRPDPKRIRPPRGGHRVPRARPFRFRTA